MLKHLLTMHKRNFGHALFFMAVVMFVVSTSSNGAAQEWSQLDPTGGPPGARVGISGVFDGATNQLILFGGVGKSSSAPYSNVVFGDTWSLTLGAVPQWRQLTPSGSPPQARQGSSAVYDTANSRMIVFGGGFGFTSPCTNETWVLSNANSASGTPAWTRLLPSGSLPPPRIFHTAVYDPGSNRMIVYGGTNCFGGSISDGFNDVWVLSNANGLGGAPVWTQLVPAANVSSPRAYLGSAYDAASNRMTIFGGWDPTGVNYNQVWVLSNANGLGGVPTWTQLAPSGTLPTPRSSFVSVADPATNQMIIFGGGDASGDLNETWVFSGSNGLASSSWTLLSPTGTPPGAREATFGAFDPALNKVMVYGGLLSPAGTFYSDTWALQPVAPSMTVTLSATQITTLQGLTVTAVVSGAAGEPTPTGTVVLTAGSYTSQAEVLSGGSATFPVPAGVFPIGTNTLTATYAPDAPSALVYTGVSGTTSLIVSAPPSAAAPTFTPGSGIYGADQLVTVATTTPSAIVYYTTDGTVPTTSSARYIGPIVVSATGKIRAMAVASGYANSAVSSAGYIVVSSPEVHTGLASGTTTSSATLNAIVQDNSAPGLVWFMWGSSTALSATTSKIALPASTASLTANSTISGLQSKTTYYFRPVVNTAGGTTYGAIQKFTTN